VLGVAVLLALSACTALRASMAREQALVTALDAYVIPKPLAEVWPRVTAPVGLFAWGTLITWDETGPFAKRSSRWTDRSTDSGGAQTITTGWYEIVGTSTSTGSQVRYFELSQVTTVRAGQASVGEPQRTRRTDLELDLVEHFDPSAGQRIRSEAEAAAEAERSR
jgi:hypothetical protein